MLKGMIVKLMWKLGWAPKDELIMRTKLAADAIETLGKHLVDIENGTDTFEESEEMLAFARYQFEYFHHMSEFTDDFYVGAGYNVLEMEDCDELR